MKKALIVIGILLPLFFLAVAGYFFSQREVLFERKIKTDLQKITGSPVFLEGLRVKILPGSWKKAAVGIGNLQIKSPSGFTSSNMAVLKDIEMVLDPLAFLAGRWKIEKISATVAESYIETSLAGLNLAVIPALKISQTPSGPESSFEILRLELKLEKLYFVDPADPKGAIAEFDMEGKTEVFDRVKNPDLLIQAPVLSFLNKLNKGSLGLPRGLIQESVKRAVA